jgi:hypothetical protein
VFFIVAHRLWLLARRHAPDLTVFNRMALDVLAHRCWYTRHWLQQTSIWPITFPAAASVAHC